MELPLATIPSSDVSQSSLPRSVVEGSNAETLGSRVRTRDENLPRPIPQARRHAAEMRFADRLPFYLIGSLLAATALAKLWMLLTDSFADIRVGIPREILWLSVALEFWVAFENFRIRDRQVLAFINTVVFGTFAALASIRWLLGYGSCGCSGNLELPAWILYSFCLTS